jgi:hypothetical protein
MRAKRGFISGSTVALCAGLSLILFSSGSAPAGSKGAVPTGYVPIIITTTTDGGAVAFLPVNGPAESNPKRYCLAEGGTYPFTVTWNSSAPPPHSVKWIATLYRNDSPAGHANNVFAKDPDQTNGKHDGTVRFTSPLAGDEYVLLQARINGDPTQTSYEADSVRLYCTNCPPGVPMVPPLIGSGGTGSGPPPLNERDVSCYPAVVTCNDGSGGNTVTFKVAQELKVYRTLYVKPGSHRFTFHVSWYDDRSPWTFNRVKLHAQLEAADGSLSEAAPDFVEIEDPWIVDPLQHEGTVMFKQAVPEGSRLLISARINGCEDMRDSSMVAVVVR